MRTTPEAKLAARVEIVNELARAFEQELLRPPEGCIGAEIAAQKDAGGWEREDVPMKTGWHSAQQHTAAALGHLAVLSRCVEGGCHVATGGLLARGVAESSSLVVWLLDPSQSIEVRSLRALADAEYSTNQLRLVYEDGNRDEESTDAKAALRRIQTDGDTAGGAGVSVPKRPTFSRLVSDLYGETVSDASGDSEPWRGPVYRHLSALSHGTKWAVNHYSNSSGVFVSVGARTKFFETLMFYAGMAVLRVADVGHRQLGWDDYVDLCTRFLALGTCDKDLGH